MRHRPMLCLLLVAVTAGGASAQGVTEKAPPPPQGAALLKTDLMAVYAHPDDETGAAAALAHYALGKGKVVANVYCTRGEGGGNMVGTQWGPALGVLREAELRRCLDQLGVRYCYFLDREDFFYTESVAATLEKWNKEQTLERVVRLIRALRPDVIITMNPAPTPGQHGHHQAAAVLATEAFDAAADPARFPEQLKKEGLSVWQVRKLYFGGGEPGHAAMIDVTKPLPGGGTAADLAAKAAAEHRSQGFGGFANSPWMRRPAMFSLAKSVVPFVDAEDDLFRGLPAAEGKLNRVQPPASSGGEAALSLEFVPRPAVAEYRRWAAAQGIEHLSAKLVSDVPVVAGERNRIELEVRNAAAGATAGATAGELQLTAPSEWRLEPATLAYRVQPGATQTLRFRITPPASAHVDTELVATTQAGGDTATAVGQAHPVPMAKVVRVKGAPALDGTDAGWADVAAIEVPPTSLAEGKVRDAADSSARFRLAHDGTTLFVDVDVADDVVVSNIAPDDVRGHWRSDSVEICVDPTGGAEHTLACFKVGIFPFDSTGTVRAARDADANQGPIEETAPGTRVVSKRTAAGYRVQVAIPLREIGIDPATHPRAGFNVIVYDGDKRDAAPGENINKSRIAWSPRAGVQGRPEDWGRIEFAAAVEAPHSPRAGAGPSDWKNPLVKKGYLNSPLVETTPFVFGDRLYLGENYQAFVDSPSKTLGADAEKDALRIRDVETGKIVSVALREHAFGTVFVSGDRVYAFSAKNAKGKPWRTATSVSMTSSTDLKNWSDPRTVLEAEGAEQIFNVAVCRGPDRFVLLYETNDAKYPPFTFEYCESDDLVNWRRIPGALYGTEKYVGGPALYYEGDREGGWYYTLFLEALPDTEYETRITRSRDLKHWQDAPPGRPFLTFDRAKKNLPLRPPELPEKNASDAELCYFKGRTIVYFTGSDQQVAGDLQRAEFEGTPRELFEHFFEGVTEPALAPK